MDFDILESFNGYASVGANTGMQTFWVNLANNGTYLESGLLPWGSRMVRMVQGSGSNTVWRRARGENRSAFADHFWFLTNTLANWANHSFYYVLDGAVAQLALQLNTDGSFRLVNGNGTVLGTSPIGLITPNTPTHIAVLAEIGNADAPFEVFINGASVISGLGDTQNTANPYTTGIQLICPDTAGTDPDTWFGELACRPTNAFAGMLRSQRRSLIASPVQGWSRSSGDDNFALVDEDQVSTVDYVDALADGTEDEYTLGPAPFAAESVAAVRLAAYGRSTDSALRQVNLQCLSGATKSDGANIVLPAQTNLIERYIGVDPATGAEWTVGAAEAFDMGLKLAA